MQSLSQVSGMIVDVVNQKTFPGTICIKNGKITSIVPQPKADPPLVETTYILPGFVDAHIHIESSMVPPSEFSRLALPHGTVATVSDPHEIANVCGLAGVDYMIRDGQRTPLTIAWGAPPCVPATAFETTGATLDSQAVEKLLDNPSVHYLSEMMNYPGILHKDKDLLSKIKAAKQRRKPIDGHAPGLRGNDLAAYIASGISTDHEAYQLDEALEKVSLGMKIIIREGSAAKNFAALHPLLTDQWQDCMFGSDDKHPNDLVGGHINEVVRRAVALGYDPLHVLFCACVHPVHHYGLDVGLLQVGDRADFIEVDNLTDFTVLRTVVKGAVVAEKGEACFEYTPVPVINNFSTTKKKPEEFGIDRSGVVPRSETVREQIKGRVNSQNGRTQVQPGSDSVRVIEALDGQLITNEVSGIPGIENDILKIAVVNRYQVAPPAIGYIKGFGLKQGAIASTVAHDSHNIVAVGVSDEAICRVVNLLIDAQGGIAAAGEGIEEILPLPIAGLMSDQDGYEVAQAYTRLDAVAKKLGSSLTVPFMTLSFMALPVIPKLKMTDKGLFDVEKFELVGIES